VDFNVWKKYFYISLIFNIIVIGTFLIFSFLVPSESLPEVKAKKIYKHPLTPAQKKKLDNLYAQQRNELIPIQVRSTEKRLRFWKALMAENPDSTQLLSILQSLRVEEQQVREIRNRYYLRRKLVLTPEQRQEQILPIYQKMESYLTKLKAENR